jgi:hypothetical protein
MRCTSLITRYFTLLWTGLGPLTSDKSSCPGPGFSTELVVDETEQGSRQMCHMIEHSDRDQRHTGPLNMDKLTSSRG